MTKKEALQLVGTKGTLRRWGKTWDVVITGLRPDGDFDAIATAKGTKIIEKIIVVRSQVQMWASAAQQKGV